MDCLRRYVSDQKYSSTETNGSFGNEFLVFYVFLTLFYTSLFMSPSREAEQAAQTVYRNKEGKRVTRAELLEERARGDKVKVR